MRWSLRLATVLGIRIEVHVTFLLLLLAYVAMSRAANPAEVAVVVGDVLLLFGCVLLHELGHALMARRYGVNTREIVLTGIGGIARLERMPERPLHEMMVALAGPAVNVVLATLVGVFLLQRHESWDAITEAALAGSALEFLFYVNVVMFFFNLIPAFPMDGGRVLRAVLAMMMPFARATRYASLVGQGFAVVFAVVGTLVTHNLALVAIALFVFLTAREERALVQTRSSLTGTRSVRSRRLRLPPSRRYSGMFAALPRMSHSARSMPDSASAAPAPRPWLESCMRLTRAHTPTTLHGSMPASSGLSVWFTSAVTAPGLRPGWASP